MTDGRTADGPDTWQSQISFDWVFTESLVFLFAGCWLVHREQKPWVAKSLMWREDCTAVTWVQLIVSELTLIMTVRYLLTPAHFSHMLCLFFEKKKKINLYPDMFFCLLWALFPCRGHNQRKQREPVDGSVSQQPGARRQGFGKTVRLWIWSNWR